MDLGLVSRFVLYCVVLFFLNMVVFPLSQLEQMCLDETPVLPDVTTTESQKQNIQAVLGLVEQSPQTDQSTSVLTALHLISSALDGEKKKLCSVQR